jgi:hypothetical protein
MRFIDRRDRARKDRPTPAPRNPGRLDPDLVWMGGAVDNASGGLGERKFGALGVREVQRLAQVTFLAYLVVPPATCVNSRSEVLPTYRVGAPVVRAQTSPVDAGGLRLNRRARVEALRQALSAGS